MVEINNTRELISVIVAVYNVEEYLMKCINSICEQTYRNLQIILVDDGSSDSSGDICDQFVAKDHRVEVIHKSNGGLVSARKEGLKIAKGDYIGFVDGDDYIEPTMYEELRYLLKKNMADISHVNIFDEEGLSFGKVNGVYELTIPGTVFFLENYILEHINRRALHWGIVTKLFRAKIIKRSYACVPNDQSYGEDLIAFCKSVIIADRIAVTDRPYYHYRIRSDSVSHSELDFWNYVNLSSVLYKLFSESQLFEELYSSLTHFCLNRVASGMETKGIILNKYLFPDMSLLQNKRIILYGAGNVGRDYYMQISCYSSCSILAWIDRNNEKKENNWRSVESVEHIKDYIYDFILIAVLYEQDAKSIVTYLLSFGIDREKIIWNSPQQIY